MKKLVCDVCGDDADVQTVVAHYHPHRTHDLCPKCRADLQNKRDAAAAATKAREPDGNHG